MSRLSASSKPGNNPQAGGAPPCMPVPCTAVEATSPLTLVTAEELKSLCILDCVKKGIETPGFNQCIRDCNIFVEQVAPYLFVGVAAGYIFGQLARAFVISRGTQVAYDL